MFNTALTVTAIRNFQKALSSKDTSNCEKCAKYEECTMVGKTNCLEFEKEEER